MQARLTFRAENYRLIRASCSKTSQLLSPGFDWAWTAASIGVGLLDRAVWLLNQFRAYGRAGAAPAILYLEDNASGILTCARPSDHLRHGDGSQTHGLSVGIHRCRVGGRGPGIGIGSGARGRLLGSFPRWTTLSFFAVADSHPRSRLVRGPAGRLRTQR